MRGVFGDREMRIEKKGENVAIEQPTFDFGRDLRLIIPLPVGR